ncbi:MAG: type II toxin-antitoxin system PemK/MazF family toxin [Planctomycetales bacterium]|nr:type II toxin-antitoxin system PemK/MazF family toxin [Planctomycetales bacterium]
MKRLDVWLVNLDPTVGSEIRKTRPAIVVSPDELNAHLQTVIVVPLTTGQAYAFRVPTRVQGQKELPRSTNFEPSTSDDWSRKSA